VSSVSRDQTIDSGRIAGSRFDLVSRHEPDGRFHETWCICESDRWRTVFMAPGATLLAAEAPEEIWGWQIGQWPRLSGGRGPGTWGEGIHAAISAPVVMACLPEPLQIWVVEATVLGLDRMELELEVAPAEQKESLRIHQRALQAQVAEWTTSDGTAGAA
jgi:hypothetical protein